MSEDLPITDQPTAPPTSPKSGKAGKDKAQRKESASAYFERKLIELGSNDQPTLRQAFHAIARRHPDKTNEQLWAILWGEEV